MPTPQQQTTSKSFMNLPGADTSPMGNSLLALQALIRYLGLTGVPLYIAATAGLLAFIIENIMGINIPYFYIDGPTSGPYLIFILGLYGLGAKSDANAHKTVEIALENRDANAKVTIEANIMAVALANGLSPEVVTEAINALKLSNQPQNKSIPAGVGIGGTPIVEPPPTAVPPGGHSDAEVNAVLDSAATRQNQPN